MDKYINKLNMYLPIDFGEKENNEYRQYLMGSFIENCQNGKYQFALMAYHMMFMSFLYKEFWGIIVFSFYRIRELCNNDNTLNGIVQATHKVFDLSSVSEKSLIDKYLSGVLELHRNKKDTVQEFVNKRDRCAHASGFVQFDKNASIRYFEEVLEYSNVISSANIQNIGGLFTQRLNEYFISDSFKGTLTGEYINNEIRRAKYSIKNIEGILPLPIPQYIENDEAGDFTVAYYYAMIQLHSLYLDRAFEDHLNIEQNHFTDKLYLFVSMLEQDKREKLQVQLEDELIYLRDEIGCSIPLGKIEQLVMG